MEDMRQRRDVRERKAVGETGEGQGDDGDGLG
jgi:hypothetical protein